MALALALWFVAVLSCAAMAGESDIPKTCDRSIDEFMAHGGDAYRKLDKIATDRLILFLNWSARPAEADQAWAGDVDDKVIVIFGKWPCVSGLVTMDKETFDAVTQGRPLPRSPVPLASPARAIYL